MLQIANELQIIQVGIGEARVGRGAEILRATLGSCVGIGLFWRGRGIYGLAHCLLPGAPAGSPESGARFVDRAGPHLLKLMGVPPHRRDELEAVLVGGGNLAAPEGADGARMIGHLNARAADKMLSVCGIKTVHRDIGGEEGRKIVIRCDRGAFEVVRIPRLAA